MVKIRIKPTPAQARILRALDENLGLFLGWIGRQGWWEGIDKRRVSQELGNPQAKTIHRMKREGWIEQPSDNENFWYYTITGEGCQAIAELSDDDFVPPAPKMKSNEILSALRNRYKIGEWLWCEELHVEGWRTRRLDVFAMRIIAGRERDLTSYLTRMAIEIKVDRNDFLNEIKDSNKRHPAMAISNVFIFATPAGLIASDEVPKECGLLEIHSQNRTRMKVRPPWRISDPPDWLLIARIARSMIKYI